MKSKYDIGHKVYILVERGLIMPEITHIEINKYGINYTLKGCSHMGPNNTFTRTEQNVWATKQELAEHLNLNP